MPMNKDAMKTKIKAAYNTRTGLNLSEGDFNTLVDLCQGIIEEMIAGATISGQIVIPSGSSAGTFNLTDGKVQS